MTKLSLLTLFVCLASCSALESVEPKDARDALTQARNACAISQAVSDNKELHEACGALTDAVKAAHDAAEKVVEATK